MFNRKCKITFVSHGSTIFTQENRLYDICDYPPLNDEGKNQIQKLALWLKKNDPEFDIIYSSPAKRAIQSANIIASEYKKDYEIINDVNGKNMGAWGGKTFSQIEKKFPEQLDQYHKNPCKFHPEGGESLEDLSNRVKSVLDEIVQNNTGRRVLIITHCGFIQSAIANAIQAPAQNCSRVYVPTASASQINYYKEWSSLVYSSFVQY